MPKGVLKFRVPQNPTTWTDADSDGFIDAFTHYGISFDETALSKLMTPAPNKEIVENKSDLENGKRVYRVPSDVKKDERNVSLTMYITATSQSDFFTKYNNFCSEILDKGFIDIKTIHCPDKIFRMTYIDCTQFSEFCKTIGKFILNLNEPDPTNRGVNDSWET